VTYSNPGFVDVSSLLLLTLSAIKSFSLGEGPSLHFNPAFIKGINHYLSHLDPAVRRCGMLAAEIAATQTGKELSFGGWDDDGPQKNESNEWRVWARGLRQLVQSDTRDWDIDISKLFKEIPDGGASQTNTGVVWGFSTESPKITVRPEQDSDDDSLVGYDSDDEVTRSRTPSPTPSELDELEHDPTIHVGRKRIRPPVYLVDLGAMLREKFDITGEEANNKGGDDNAEEKAEAVRIALEHAEDMIRRRRTFGAELGKQTYFCSFRLLFFDKMRSLDECAVDLVHALVAMRNNFELDNFDEQRQKALIALVACSPRKAPP
jgi:telomere length regulation protein